MQIAATIRKQTSTTSKLTSVRYLLSYVIAVVTEANNNCLPCSHQRLCETSRELKPSRNRKYDDFNVYNCTLKHNSKGTFKK